MTKVTLKEVTEYSKKFKDLEEVKKEIKSVQSIKCRLKKQKSKSTYETEMSNIVKKEQLLKEVRELFEPKKMTVTKMSKSDIELLDYDGTIKAIKSIQSKKCNSQFLTDNIETNVEYQESLRIEKMLLDHKEVLKSTQNFTQVKKSNINDLINHLESSDDKLTKEYLLEQLKKLTN